MVVSSRRYARMTARRRPAPPPRGVLSILSLLAAFAVGVTEVAAATCPCDCDGNRVVAVNELVRGVRTALDIPDTQCAAFAAEERVGIDTLVRCVQANIVGCPPPPPNIVLIIGDDQGWPHSRFMGDPYVTTPSLDRLAQRGTLFTNVHNTASVCRASLITLLAGAEPQQWLEKLDRLENALGPIAAREEVVYYRTLPRELAELGYRSWEGGKMWEGTFAQAGFTDGLALAPPRNPFTNDGANFGRDGWEEGTALEPFADFLDDVGDEPFFAWVAPMLPHVPFDAGAEFRGPYEEAGLDPDEVDYYANVTWLDSVVGAVIDEIEQRGLSDHTLIVYLSDNGWEIGGELLTPGSRGKTSLYELGFRTPLIFSWPGVIDEGVVRNDLASTLDLFPTLLDYACGAQLPDRLGRSLRAAVERGLPTAHTEIVGHHFGTAGYNTGYFVRTEQWRYIDFEDGHEELYEIAEDPFEENDVAADHLELIEGFREDVRRWQERIDATPLECPECGGSQRNAA